MHLVRFTEFSKHFGRRMEQRDFGAAVGNQLFRVGADRRVMALPPGQPPYPHHSPGTRQKCAGQFLEFADGFANGI